MACTPRRFAIVSREPSMKTIAPRLHMSVKLRHDDPATQASVVRGGGHGAKPLAGRGWPKGTVVLAWLALVLCGFDLGPPSMQAAEPVRQVLLIAGPPSHGPGLHEFPRGCAVLAEALNRSGLPIRAEISLGWPTNSAALEAADVVVLYSDGLEDHVARGQSEPLRQRLRAGKSLVILHFALEAPEGDEALRQLFLDAVGGRFEAGWSVNPTWKVSLSTWPSHPVARGLAAFEIEDEWYYHLRFRPQSAGVTPILAVVPPEDSLAQDGPRTGNPTVRAAVARGEPQVLAWTSTTTGGVRGFGFTGGHFHRNWYHAGFRTLVLNGIVWSAGLTVPESGVASTDPSEPVYVTLDESLARGDLVDVARHLARTPALANGESGAKMRPLHQAILRRRADMVRLLLDRGADPLLADVSQRSPLQLAVERADAGLVGLLLARGADPKARDKAGWTPLHHAGAKNQLAIARLLLDGGANPNQLSELGGTALHEAAVSGSVELIKLLLERGVDPKVVSKTNVTALDLAREYKNAPVVEFLEQRK